MKTYRDKKYNFEIDMPEEWRRASSLGLGIMEILSEPNPNEPQKYFFQYGCYNEAFNFEIGRLFPEPTVQETERQFTLYARMRRFTHLKFGGIMVNHKEHVWAKYYVQDRLGERWNKKYMIVFGETEYTITATCSEEAWVIRREGEWNSIIQSFRLI